MSMRDESSPWRHIDPVLLALPFALSGLGLLMIYSSSRTRLKSQGLSQLYYVERQGFAILLGIVAMGIVLAVDYRRLRDLWLPIYIGALAVLMSVLFIGERVKGAAIFTGSVAAYRVDRVVGFLNQSSIDEPASKQTEAEYSLIESKIAIVSGGISGQGLFKGRQTNLSYVPEQHTDFIFTVVGEELGFFGGATLIGLYGLLVWRVWRTARLSSDFFGTLLAVCVLGIFAFQVFENIGMTMGIMPITGIPLPFMSYGGSAIIASFVAIALVANVNMRRFS